jgi:Ca2+-binding EF-hand superfamily protein
MTATFADLDTDGDGKLTKEEVGKVVPEQRLEQAFSRWDADEDGSVTEEEFNNRPGPPGGMGMGG